MKGLIKFFNLENWYNNTFTNEEKEFIQKEYPDYFIESDFSSQHSFNYELIQFIPYSDKEHGDLWKNEKTRFLMASIKNKICKKTIENYLNIQDKLELFNFLTLFLENCGNYFNIWNDERIITMCNDLINLSNTIIPILKQHDKKLPKNIGYDLLYRIESSKKNWKVCLASSEQGKSEGWPGNWTLKIKHCNEKIDEELKNITLQNTIAIEFDEQFICNYIDKIPFKNLLYLNKEGYALNEPSTIFTDLPVHEVTDTTLMPRVGAYPNYLNFTPEQRFVYLQWLNNLEGDIDISYVFLFFYGLERRLFDKKYEEELVLFFRPLLDDKNNKIFKSNTNTVFSGIILLILNLRKKYINKVFQQYSMDTILFSLKKKKQNDLICKYLQYESCNSIYFTEAYYYFKYITNSPLNAREIVGAAKYVDFKNDRYIKRDLQKFIDILEIVMMEKNKNITFDLSQFAISDKNRDFENQYIPANTSLFPEIRDYYTNIFWASQKLCDYLFDLLQETHYRIKTNKI